MSPYQLPDALGELATTISGLNTTQLADSLQVVADTFSATPPELRVSLVADTNAVLAELGTKAPQSIRFRAPSQR